MSGHGFAKFENEDRSDEDEDDLGRGLLRYFERENVSLRHEGASPNCLQ